MKVYVVTSGCYSDYGIDKVFTDRAKAEEFCEWHTGWNGDSSRIEEYETEDDLVVDKYYKIEIEYLWYDNGAFEPSFVFTKCTYKGDRFTWYEEGKDRYGYFYELTLYRYVSAENLDEEFYTNKYKKAVYDFAAIIKAQKAEGATEKDILELLEGMSDDE